MDTDKGLFLTFDGVPRSGRTHQANRLAESLRLDGHDVVRVSMPEDTTPIAKTSLAWLSGRLAAYLTMVETQVRPALEAGNIVILDGGITSALIRTRAVMGANAPTGYLYILDCIAMRVAAVDVEWMFMGAREGERDVPGFDCIDLWKHAICSHAVCTTIPEVPTAGARRHATYLMHPKHVEGLSTRFPGIVAALLAERMDDKWQTVIEETQEQRDVALVSKRMGQWTDPTDPQPLYGAVANWMDYSDATRMAAVNALPTRKGVVQELLRAIQATGAALPSGEVGAVLNAMEKSMSAMDGAEN